MALTAPADSSARKKTMLLSFRIGAISLCAAAGFAFEAPRHGELRVLPNGEAIVVAKVMNERYCDRDGACALKFNVGGKMGAVVYSHGDVEGVKPCGRELFNTAWSIRDGTRIEARGRYRDTGAMLEIDICATSDAFLRVAR